MSQSSSSSSDESDAEDRQTSMKNLADVVWQKLKNDGVTSKLSDKSITSESVQERVCDKGITSESAQERLQTSKLIFSSLPEKVKALTNTTPQAKTSKQSSSSSTAKPGQGIIALHQKKVEEALKAVSKASLHKQVSERQRKKQAKAEKAQWRGRQGTWGAMKMKEQTQDDKRDLMLLSMRSTIDPTRHYKHNDLKAPKFFQIGTVEENAVNFYHDRVPKKKRKRTLLDELMADDDFKRQTKQRYQEVMALKTGRKGLYHGKAPHKVNQDKTKKKRRK